MRTAQEIFDTVARHLLSQNAQCMSDDGCAYRNDAGMKCAVGCLIPDDEYKPEFESQMVSYLVARSSFLTEERRDEFREHQSLLTSLQSLHDNNGPGYWPSRLHSIANEFGLKPDVLLSEVQS